MPTFLKRRHSEDVRVLQFIHAMRAITPAQPATAPVVRTDTVQFPRIVLTAGAEL